MIFGFVLLCSVALSGPECQPSTAGQAIRVLDEAGNFAVFDLPMACLRDSIIWAAKHVRIPQGLAPKVACTHSHPANQG